MAGLIFVDRILEDKPGSSFPRDSVITVKMPKSLCGQRRAEAGKALDCFAVNVAAKIIDVGASTEDLLTVCFKRSSKGFRG